MGGGEICTIIREEATGVGAVLWSVRERRDEQAKSKMRLGPRPPRLEENQTMNFTPPLTEFDNAPPQPPQRSETRDNGRERGKKGWGEQTKGGVCVCVSCIRTTIGSQIFEEKGLF